MRRFVPKWARRLGRRVGLDALLKLIPENTDDAAHAWQRERAPDELRSWIETYTRTTGLPYRLALANAVEHMPATAALELGCHVGPNLRVLAERNPHLRLTGIEINRQAAEAATAWLRDLPNVEVLADDLRTFLPRVPTGSYDVIFSCYSLAYLAPRDLRGVLAHAFRVARVGVVLLEPHRFSSESSLDFGWRHDYIKAWSEAVPSCSPRAVRVGPFHPGDDLNAIIVVERAEGSDDPTS